MLFSYPHFFTTNSTENTQLLSDEVLHGFYHEDRNGKFDDFFYKTKASAEQKIRAGLDISRDRDSD
jgi:hypothetical protein